MLAGQYAATRSPPGLKRLIIANSPASMKLTEEGTTNLLHRFPEDFVRMVRKHEADGTCESAEYQEATMQFYQKHICTLNPWPEELNASFGAVAKNPTVYQTMYVVFPRLTPRIQVLIIILEQTGSALLNSTSSAPSKLGQSSRFFTR